jgi:hypothetical protein
MEMAHIENLTKKKLDTFCFQVHVIFSIKMSSLKSLYTHTRESGSINLYCVLSVGG